VQVDPIKPKLKPAGTQRLKLKYDELLLNLGFKFKLRRYTKVAPMTYAKPPLGLVDPLPPRTVSKRDRASAMARRGARRARASPRPFAT
jgi:hypothetical protein